MGGALRGRLPGSSFLTATSRSDLGEIIGTGNIVGVSETAADRMFEEMMSSGVYDDEQIGRLQGQLDELKQGKEIGCLLYTSAPAGDTPCVDLGGRRII